MLIKTIIDKGFCLRFVLQIHMEVLRVVTISVLHFLPNLKIHLSNCCFLPCIQVSQEAPPHAKLLQSCPTLCDPIDGSPPASPVPGILKARTLESVAISFSSVKNNHCLGNSLVAQWLGLYTSTAGVTIAAGNAHLVGSWVPIDQHPVSAAEG